MADDVATWTATNLAAAIRAKELSSRELLDLYADRIERLNPAVNAVVTLDLERARTAATAADEALARGFIASPKLNDFTALPRDELLDQPFIRKDELPQ